MEYRSPSRPPIWRTVRVTVVSPIGRSEPLGTGSRGFSSSAIVILRAGLLRLRPSRPRRLACDLAALLGGDTLPAGLAALQSALPAEGDRVRVLPWHGRHLTMRERSCSLLTMRDRSCIIGPVCLDCTF